MWTQLPWWQKAGLLVGSADPYLSIFYGAVLSAIVVVLLTLIVRVCPIRKAVDAGLDGMARMFPALVILILAWALSESLQRLGLGAVENGQVGVGGPTGG